MNSGDKIKRNSNYLKIFMVFIFLVQIIEIYQADAFEFRDVISIIGVLILFTGFLLSPVLLVTPIKELFKAFSNVSSQSNSCFTLGLLLVIFSGSS